MWVRTWRPWTAGPPAHDISAWSQSRTPTPAPGPRRAPGPRMARRPRAHGIDAPTRPRPDEVDEEEQLSAVDGAVSARTLRTSPRRSTAGAASTTPRWPKAPAQRRKTSHTGRASARRRRRAPARRRPYQRRVMPEKIASSMRSCAMPSSTWDGKGGGRLRPRRVRHRRSCHVQSRTL